MTVPVLTHRCWNHGERPAVVRCPACGRHFCRECTTEHDGRMICAACVRTAAAGGQTPRLWPGRIRRCIQTMVAVFLVWLVFYQAGRTLADLPVDVHDGTLWREVLEEEEESRP